MKKFEYCFITNLHDYHFNRSELIFSDGQDIKLQGKELANVLHDLGKDGWEMVGGTIGDSNYLHTIFFKREIEG